MEITQKFNRDIIFNYTPSIETMELGLLVMEKIGKLNVRIKDVFGNHEIASKIFAIIESKYSSRVEGIYTTLFDVINGKTATKQQKIIKPLIEELFDPEGNITVSRLESLDGIINSDSLKKKRWNKDFGIYETKDGVKQKVYQPPMDKQVTAELLDEIINKASQDDNIIKMLHTHVMFEKVHPFTDTNGWLGRLVLQRSLSKLMNFSSVLPLSSAIFLEQGLYYKAFDIHTKDDLDRTIKTLLNIILKMYDTTKAFLIELSSWTESSISHITNISNKVTDALATDIVLSLQTQVPLIVKKYGINRKTVDSIFTKANEKVVFDRKLVSKKVTYWNVELEGIIDIYYR